MEGPSRARLPDGRRRHFQHGPIDLVLEAFGESRETQFAYEQAWDRFCDLLGDLVEEIQTLRTPVRDRLPEVRGTTAGRMLAAIWPHRRVFVTPMAAVAGAVADEVLEAMVAGRRLERAYVNNGGDIAIYLAPDQKLDTGIVTSAIAPSVDGAVTIAADMAVRGIATSGRSGRSFSLGVADAVTVLARDAAAADVAATLIGNAIDVDHPGVERVPAVDLDPDSDLGDRLVTVRVGPLDEGSVAVALGRGVRRAEEMRRSRLIEAALLSLSGQVRCVSALPKGTTDDQRMPRRHRGHGERTGERLAPIGRHPDREPCGPQGRSPAGLRVSVSPRPSRWPV